MESGLELHVRLEGFDRFAASLARVDVNQRTRTFLDGAGWLVESEARRRAPVNVGLLRSSIFHEVDQQEPPRWVDIGSKVRYAPYMEYGTGTVHDHPTWPHARHIPFVNRDENGRPVAALFWYAKRKGLGYGGGYAIARAIAKRGGLKPRRYLRGSLEDLAPKIRDAWVGVRDSIVRDLGGLA